MAFYIVTGTMGGGKSLYCVEQALKCFREGGRVHSNIDWVEGALEDAGFAHLHIKLADDPTKWRSQLIGGAEGSENLLIVDESAMTFHVWDQMSNKDRDRDLFDTLVMSRKLGLDVFFITQALENIAAAIRRMAMAEIHCIDVKRVPVWGPIAKRFFGDFKRITLTPQKRKSLNSVYARFDPIAGAMYKTEQVRGVATEVPQDATRKAQVIKTPVWLKIAALLIVLTVCASAYYFYRMTRGVIERATKPKVVTEGTKAPTKPEAKDPPSFSLTESFKQSLVSTAEQGQTHRPQLHPFGGDKIRPEEWNLFEWSEDDERIILAVDVRHDITVYTLGGERWKVGGYYDGEQIKSIIPWNGRFYVSCTSGRTFLLRPRTYREVREFQEYQAITSQQNQQKPQGNSQTPWYNPFSSSPPALAPAGL